MKEVKSCFEIKLNHGFKEAYILALDVEEYNKICGVWKTMGFKADFLSFDTRPKVNIPYWLK